MWRRSCSGAREASLVSTHSQCATRAAVSSHPQAVWSTVGSARTRVWAVWARRPLAPPTRTARQTVWWLIVTASKSTPHTSRSHSGTTFRASTPYLTSWQIQLTTSLLATRKKLTPRSSSFITHINHPFMHYLRFSLTVRQVHHSEDGRFRFMPSLAECVLRCSSTSPATPLPVLSQLSVLSLAHTLCCSSLNQLLNRSLIVPTASVTTHVTYMSVSLVIECMYKIIIISYSVKDTSTAAFDLPPSIYLSFSAMFSFLVEMVQSVTE